MAVTVQGASLSGIYNRLNSAPVYHPYEAETFADWSLEAGDMVSVARGNEIYESPVHGSKMVWKGTPQITLESTGNKERESVAKVSKRKYSKGSGGMRTQQNLHHELYSADGYLWSMLDYTESYMRSVFEDDLNGLRGEVEQTASYWRSTYEDIYNGMLGEVEQTASYWRSTYEDLANNMRGEVEQTASYWRSTYEDLDNCMRGVVEQTASYWRSTYEDLGNCMRGQVEQTAAYWRSTYEDLGNNMRGEVEQTASYWRSAYQDVYNGFSGIVEQTASYWRSVYSDALNNNGVIEETASYWRAEYSTAQGLTSQLEITASYYRNAYSDIANSLRSSVEQTASYWRSTLVDEGTSQVSRIEQTAGSLKIQASQVYIDANTTLDGKLKVKNGTFTIEGQTNLDGNVYVTAGHNLYLQGGSTFNINSSTPSTPTLTMTYDNFKNMIVSAEVDSATNTLTLTPLSGTAITFRKAASGGVSGNWSGNKFTASAVEEGPSYVQETFGSKFGASSGQYYIAATHIVGQNQTEISGTTNNYQLGLNGTIVQLQTTDAAHTQISGTPSLTVPLQISNITKNNSSADTYYVPTGNNIGFLKVHVAVPEYVKGTWNGNRWTVSHDETGTVNSLTETFDSIFVYSGGKYYISASHLVSGSQQSISGTTKQIKLGLNGTTVQIQNGSGTKYDNTPTYSIPLTTKSITSNGPYTPTGNNVGFSSVSVAITPTLTGSWSNNKLTVSSSPAAAANYSTTITSGFTYASSAYFITASHSNGEITSARKQIKLGLSGTTVQVQNASGTQYGNTPTYSIPLETKSITAIGTYTPSSGKVGFSSVTVSYSPSLSALSTSSLSSGNRTHTVPSGKDGYGTVTVTPVTISSVTQNGAATFSTDKKTVNVGIKATASNSATGTNTLSISTSESYNAGKSDGVTEGENNVKNGLTLSAGEWGDGGSGYIYAYYNKELIKRTWFRWPWFNQADANDYTNDKGNLITGRIKISIGRDGAAIATWNNDYSDAIYNAWSEGYEQGLEDADGGTTVNANVTNISANNNWPSSQSADQFFGKGVSVHAVTLPSSVNQQHRYIKFKVGTAWHVFRL